MVPWNSTAVIELTTTRPVCLELHSRYKQLGKFTLREGGQTIAAGFVTELFPLNAPAGGATTATGTGATTS